MPDLNVDSASDAAPAETTSSESAPPQAAPEPSETGPRALTLTLGTQIGTLLGLTVFSGMYSLFAHELRIAATLFVVGCTMGLVGWMVTTLSVDALHLRRHLSSPSVATPSRFLESLWDGLGVGLGILLGMLPISLGCSMLYHSPAFPAVIYGWGTIALVAIGIVQAPSRRALPTSIAYALLPGLVAVLAAHALGDFVCERLIIP
jgi:putative Mn2+ efflux pump MntP